MRDAFLDFSMMFLIVTAYSALQRLHAVGQGVLGILIDSAGIAGAYSLLKYFIKKKPDKS